MIEKQQNYQHKCDVCGRVMFKKIRYGGYTLCSKHMHQLHKFGRFLDNNPRTQNDLNEYHFKNDVVEFDLYNGKCEVIEHFIIDRDDFNKVRYLKWRLSHGYVVSGQPAKKQQKYLSRVIMNLDKDDNRVVDHVNGDTLDNRKSNLRISSQGENTLNKHKMSLNTTGIIGVFIDKRKGRKNSWCAEIRKGYKRYHVGAYRIIEEAAYARFVAETILFGDMRNTNNDDVKMLMFDKLNRIQKRDIESRVHAIIEKKNKEWNISD